MMSANYDESAIHSPDYGELSTALSHNHIGLSAAEAHGILCGYLFNDRTDEGAESWYGLMLGKGVSEHSVPPALKEMLAALRRSTQASLNSDRFQFRPLIPPDDSALTERTDAVADWCSGFVQGLIRDNSQDIEQFPGDLPELLRDIMAFSEAEPGAGDPDEQEKALTEIEEYLRAAIQAVYDELMPPSAALKVGLTRDG